MTKGTKQKGTKPDLEKEAALFFEDMVGLYSDHAYYPQLRLPEHQSARLDRALKRFAKVIGRKW